MSRDQTYFNSTGIKISSKDGLVLMRRVLRAYENNLPIGPIIQTHFEGLSTILADAMALAYMYGWLRIRKYAPDNVMVFSVYSKAKRFMRKRLAMPYSDLKEISGYYQIKSLLIMERASSFVEARLQGTMNYITAQGMHVKQGIQTLEKSFQKAGITPKSHYQLESIFRTQTALAYSAGQWDQLQDPVIQSVLWGFKYSTVGDNRVREGHRTLEGMQAPKEHAVWQTHMPPNGWSCRCVAIPLFGKRRQRIPSGDLTTAVDEGFAFNPGTVFNPLHATAKQEVAYRNWLVGKATGRSSPLLHGKPKSREYWNKRLADYDKKVGHTEAVVIPKTKLPKTKPPIESKKVSTLTKSYNSIEGIQKVHGFETVTATKVRDVALAFRQTMSEIRSMFPELVKHPLKKLRVVKKNFISGRTLGKFEPSTRTTSIAIKDRAITASLKMGDDVWAVDGSVTGTLRHEYGHSLYERFGAKEWQELYFKHHRKAYHVSRYATTDSYELFAESFSVYTHSQYGIKFRLPRVIEEFFESRLGKHPNLVGKKAISVKKTTKVVKKSWNKETIDWEDVIENDEKLVAWADSLTVKEGKALRDYSNTKYREVRKYQETGKGSKAIRETVEHMETAYATSPRYTGRAFRGIDGTKDPKKLKAWTTKGNVVETQAWTSTSIHEPAAGEFGNVLMEIKLKRTGMPLRAGAITAEEFEVLIPKGIKLRVKSVSRDGTRIVLEQI